MNYKFIIQGRPMTKKNSMTKTRYGLIQARNRMKRTRDKAVEAAFESQLRTGLDEEFGPVDIYLFRGRLRIRKHSIKEVIRLIDMSMERIRTVIDRACRDGKNYATIEKSGDDAVDAAVAQTLDSMGYKVAVNPQGILISWS